MKSFRVQVFIKFLPSHPGLILEDPVFSYPLICSEDLKSFAKYSFAGALVQHGKRRQGASNGRPPSSTGDLDNPRGGIMVG
jgi:hypothetical protein